MRYPVFFQTQASIRQSIVRWLVALIIALGLLGKSTLRAEEKAHAVEATTSAVSIEAKSGGSTDAHESHGAHGGGHHGLSSAAPEVPFLTIGPLSVTNSMMLTWIIAAGIIIFARRATAYMKEVPEGAQNFWEFLVESLFNFLETIIGSDLAKKTFWFFATIFIFILFTNWAGLLPGVGTIGWGTPNHQGYFSHFSVPLFRGTSADLNMTLAMALVFFACWCYWAWQSNGIGGTIVHIFGNPARGEMKGILAMAMAAVFVLVGLLEVISILFRPVSLSFRLYGNIFAGENLLESMAGLYAPLAAVIPLPFYFMELLVGLVQALVFMLLTAVFTLLICSHGDDHSHEHDEAHH
jgi:F-type H+-transporting ATPase subunit a